MRIIIGADHRGFNLKERLKEWMEEGGIEFEDIGAHEYNPEDDYVDFAIKLGEKVLREKVMGIIICGGGGGVCIAANKVKGARAVLCSNEKQARIARSDDDANVLCLSAETIDEETNKEITSTFINSVFSAEERHLKRIEAIKNYES